MADMHEDRQTLRITALPVADVARILAAAYGRRVTEEQVREVIEAGGLLRPDGTVSLIEYVAFLVREVSHAGSD
jgi:hypothetical protein